MPILVALVLAPMLAFYVYALGQFWIEAMRRRCRDASAMIVPLQSSRTPVSEFPARLGEIEPAARAPVVTTCPRNRVAAFQSGTGRLAPKRAAKG